MKVLFTTFICVIFCCSCASGTNKESANDNSTATDSVLQSNIQTRPDRKLKHLFFANGGLIGYFSDGTKSGCPKCDLCKDNIDYLLKAEPFDRYDDSTIISEKEGASEDWAMFNYKWLKKVGPCESVVDSL